MPTKPSNTSLSGAVIFDTNAYRNLTFGRSLAECRTLITDLTEKEKAAGTTAYAHPIVAWELFAHLPDPADKAYLNCLNSLVSMGEHSAILNGDGAIRMLADTYHSSTRNLFGLPEPRYEQAVLNLTTVITHITKNAPDLSHPVCQSNILHFSTQMDIIEKAWVARMTALVDAYLPGMALALFGGKTDAAALAKLRSYLSTPKFFNDWSVAYVMDRAAAVGVSLTAEELQERAEFGRKSFAAAFYLLRALLLKLVMPKPVDLSNTKKKRWNFIWDHMIAFSLGPGSVGNQDVYLVTGDGEITDAAKEAGVDAQVLKLEDYVSRIGLPWTLITSASRQSP